MTFDPLSVFVTMFAVIAALIAILGTIALQSLVKQQVSRCLLSGLLGVGVAYFTAPLATLSADHYFLNYDRPKDLIYAPKTLMRTKKYPLLLILSPDGEPWPQMKRLCAVADKYQWIVIGDDSFRNGLPMTSWLPHVCQTIRYAQEHYPVDRDRVYAGGISGGAMGSYFLTYKQPDLIRGIIANTGMMPFGSDPPADEPFPEDFPKNKPIVMLASPADFRYQAMTRNKLDLEKLGWKVKWIEFADGHTQAPVQCYETALIWLNQQP